MGGPGKGRDGKSSNGGKDKDKKDSGGEGGLLIIQKGELHTDAGSFCTHINNDSSLTCSPACRRTSVHVPSWLRMSASQTDGNDRDQCIGHHATLLLVQGASTSSTRLLWSSWD